MHHIQQWILDALRDYGKRGATLRQIQRFIDEKHCEELAINTLEEHVQVLLAQGKIVLDDISACYALVRKDSSSAFNSLFIPIPKTNYINPFRLYSVFIGIGIGFYLLSQTSLPSLRDNLLHKLSEMVLRAKTSLQIKLSGKLSYRA